MKQVEQFTEREKEVLKLIKQGMSNQEIAQELHISLETAKWHVKNIFSKFNVHDRKKLIYADVKNTSL